MKKYRLHKEGYKTISLYCLFSSLFGLYYTKQINNGSYIYIIPLFFIILLLCFFVYFFREPLIEVSKDLEWVLSPANGTVISVKEVYEGEFFRENRLQVCIFMSPLDVHINRNPIEGIVKYFKHHHGKYLVAWHPKSSEKNERTTIVLENEQGYSLLFRQIAGFVARRICYYDHENKSVEQGSQCGFIKFGSRADLYLPLDSELSVKIGDKVKAGIDKISRIKSV